jgi:hypothetical protein
MDQNKEHHWWGVAIQFATYLNNHLRTEELQGKQQQGNVGP